MTAVNVLVAATAVLAVAGLAWYTLPAPPPMRTHAAPPPLAPRPPIAPAEEAFTEEKGPKKERWGTYAMPHVQAAEDLPALSKALAGVQQEVPPHLVAPGASSESVPFEASEVRAIAAEAMRRVNLRDRSLGVSLVDIGTVSKSMNSYKTLEYVLQMNVYVAKHTMATKLVAVVVVDSKNTVFVKTLKTYNDERDESNIMGASAAELAPFQQAVSYP